jgi:hypothetical protein
MVSVIDSEGEEVDREENGDRIDKERRPTSIPAAWVQRGYAM